MINEVRRGNNCNFITKCNDNDNDNKRKKFFFTGVLGNLTALKVLDASYNELTDFPPNYFGPPENLTELYLSNNKLYVLPLKELSKLKSKIRHVDLKNNELSEFYPELMMLLNNGTSFQYSGIWKMSIKNENFVVKTKKMNE